MVRLHPWVSSLAIVPVGLTKYRKGLPSLKPVTKGYAAAFIAAWESRVASLAEKLGDPFLFIADEFYIKAGIPFPLLDSYGDLPQLENGVGMIPLFLAQAADAIEHAERLTPCRATVVTGTSPYPFLAAFLMELGRKTGVTLHPIAVKNLLFGTSVTVTGLVRGRDILAGLKGKELGDVVLIPDVMLKEGEGLFLDGLSVAELAEELDTRVVVAEATPQGICKAIKEIL
jgi:NifB/MoaA-like Fe-S oxidoreductase